MLMNRTPPWRRTVRFVDRLRDDIRGLALLEFALALPLVLAMGAYGIEISNLALSNLRVSQFALELADNASRVGVQSNLSVEQLRETDINDILQATRLQGASLKLTTYGRVTLSSLENVQQSYDTAPVQRIHWQRCVGLMTGTGYDSTYGTTSATAGSDATQANEGTAAPTGMGDAGSKVTAPAGTGVIFVEINYNYQPFFGTLFVSPTKLHYIASFIVRDKRDFSQIFNPTPTATASTCSLHTT
jgi:Flp pilus assembly protein TadG